MKREDCRCSEDVRGYCGNFFDRQYKVSMRCGYFQENEDENGKRHWNGKPLSSIKKCPLEKEDEG